MAISTTAENTCGSPASNQRNAVTLRTPMRTCRIKRNLPIVFAISGVIIMLFQAPPTGAQEPAADTGPTTLVFTYKSTPAKRIALREYAARSLPRFQKWKESGLLKDYHIFFSRYVDADSWDMMTLISFARPSGVGRWKEIERDTPAGLSAEGLALTSTINT